MELFTASRKLIFFFLTTRDVRCVHHGWHDTHRYDLQVLTARVIVGSLVFFTAAMIRSFKSRGNGGTNTRSLTYPQRKNHRVNVRGPRGAIASVVGHFQKHAVSNVLVTLCSCTDEPHSGSWRDFRLAGIWTSVCFATVALATVATCPVMSCQQRFLQQRRMNRTLFDWRLHKTHWL